MEQHRIFISHFGQEEPIAAAIEQVLARAFVGHVKVFLSSNIQMGTNWLNEIGRQLLDTHEVLTIFSHRSAERPWLNIESGYGVISGKPVTPILFGGFRKEDLSVVYQSYKAVELQNPADVERLFSDIHSRVRGRNPDAEARWNAKQFSEQWKIAVEVAMTKVPLSPRRTNDRPLIWLIGSHSGLTSKRQKASALQVSQVIAKVCLANRFQIVSGTSRMLDYLADEYENYRDYFTKHPEKLSDIENEPLRKFISSAHALDTASAPNPIILVGSLRHQSARMTFDDAIGRFPDFAILVGGSHDGRSPEEVNVVCQSKIPLLPIRFTGGVAATAKHSCDPSLNDKIDKLQNATSKMDQFALLLIEIIKQQLDLTVRTCQ